MTVVEAWNGSSKTTVSDTDSSGFIEFDEYATISVIDNEILFQGRRLDGESGLYYFRNRYYDPKTGRFLSRDPKGFVDGPNLYAFVNNNPINYVDPMGTTAIGPVDNSEPGLSGMAAVNAPPPALAAPKQDLPPVMSLEIFALNRSAFPVFYDGYSVDEPLDLPVSLVDDDLAAYIDFVMGEKDFVISISDIDEEREPWEEDWYITRDIEDIEFLLFTYNLMWPCQKSGEESGKKPEVEIRIIESGSKHGGFIGHFNIFVSGVLFAGSASDVDSVEEMMTAIDLETDHGKKLIRKLTISGHGGPGAFMIGINEINYQNTRPGKHRAIQLSYLKGRFAPNAEVYLASCDVSDGAEGKKLLKNLGDLWDVKVTAPGGNYVPGVGDIGLSITRKKPVMRGILGWDD